MSLPIVVDLGYDEEASKKDGMFRKKHVHGVLVEEKKGTVSYRVNGFNYTYPETYRRFRLTTGVMFWEFERSDWYVLDGIWGDSQQCCKDAFEAYMKEKNDAPPAQPPGQGRP